MKHSFFTAFFLLTIFANSQSTLQQLEDDFIRMNSTSAEYGGYQQGKMFLEQGEMIAESLTQELNQFSASLSTSKDPTQILNEYEQKMQELERMEAQFQSNVNQTSFQTGQQIGDNISSGNAEGAFYGTLGAIAQLYETNEAKKQLEANQQQYRQQLANEKHNKMVTIAKEMISTNESAAGKWMRNAAYTTSLSEERHYIENAQFHLCHNKSIVSKFNTKNTSWVNNPCTKPPALPSEIPNNLIKKERLYAETAARKYSYYINQSVPQSLSQLNKGDYTEVMKKYLGLFREAAIRFAAAASNEDKSNPEYHFLIGKYAGKEDAIQYYSSCLAAKELDPNFFKRDEMEGEFEKAQKAFEERFIHQIIGYDHQLDAFYLNRIIENSLHQKIKLNGKDPLLFAIEVDEPDVVQILLNNFAEHATEEQISKKLNTTLLYASLKNSPQCVNKLISLGGNVEANIKGYNCVTIAEKAMSDRVLPIALEHSSKKDYYINQFASSPTYAITKMQSALEKGRYGKAIGLVESTANKKGQEKMIMLLINLLPTSQSLASQLGSSDIIKETINGNQELQANLISDFLYEIMKQKNGNSQSYLINDLIPLNPDLTMAVSKRPDVIQAISFNTKLNWLKFVYAYEERSQFLYPAGLKRLPNSFIGSIAYMQGMTQKKIEGPEVMFNSLLRERNLTPQIVSEVEELFGSSLSIPLPYIALCSDYKLISILGDSYDLSTTNITTGKNFTQDLWEQFKVSRDSSLLIKQTDWSLPLPNGLLPIHDLAETGFYLAMKRYLSLMQTRNNKVFEIVNIKKKPDNLPPLHLVVNRFITDLNSDGIYLADFNNCGELLRILVDFGADVSFKNSEGKTAYDIIKPVGTIDWGSGYEYRPKKDWDYIKP